MNTLNLKKIKKIIILKNLKNKRKMIKKKMIRIQNKMLKMVKFSLRRKLNLIKIKNDINFRRILKFKNIQKKLCLY